MVLAAFATVGFAVAGVHAFMILRETKVYFTSGPSASPWWWVASPPFCSRPATCRPSTWRITSRSSSPRWKLTGRPSHGPLSHRRQTDEVAETTSYSIDIPGGLSFLSFMDPSAEVQGLKEFPREDRPPVTVVHVAFQIMVGCGMAMMGVAALFGWRWWRQRAVPTDRSTLRILVASTPLGLIALEAGWTVTEVGRQPWIIKGILRTADAVTPMPHLVVPFTAFSALFLMLGVVTIVLLRRIVFSTPPGPDSVAAEPSEAQHA